MKKSNDGILVSYIILNYNEKELLEKTLASIYEQGLDKSEFEIFFVDNNSDDGSAELVKKKFPDVNIIISEKNTGTAAMNLPLHRCRGKHIYWEGGDTELGKGAIKQMIQALESSDEIGGVFPRILDEDGVWRERHSYYSRTFYFYYTKEPMKNRERHAIGPGMIKKELLDRLEYIYDPAYFYSYEDHDLGLRIRLLGYKVVYEPKAVIVHRRTGSFIKRNSDFTLIKWYDRNSLMTFFKIYSWKSIVLYLPYNLFLRICFIIKDIITLRLDKAAGRVGAIVWAMMHFNYIIKQRKPIQQFRKINDKQLIKSLVDEKGFVKAMVGSFAKAMR